MDTQQLFKELRKIDEKISVVSIDIAKISMTMQEYETRTKLNEIKIKMLEEKYLRFIGFVAIGGWLLGIVASVATIVARSKGLF